MNAIFEDVLRALLVGTDVVGTRVFLMQAPQVPTSQAKVPYIVFLGIGPSPTYSQIGELTVHDGDYQVSIFDSSQSRALAAAETLRRKLGGMRGDYAGIRFGGVFYRSQTSGFETAPDLHHVIVTFRILFEFLPEFENFTPPPRKPSQPERRITL